VEKPKRAEETLKSFDFKASGCSKLDFKAFSLERGFPQEQFFFRRAEVRPVFSWLQRPLIAEVL
jgi:hypothetical protein